jgi:glycine/D-amino acid oxidase-like deaminating enzyme
MLGTTVALELAHRGQTVDLFDRGPSPITMAGLHNEGKLHLGFIYANDTTRRTTEMVASGSIHFFALLRRWVGEEVDRLPVSGPVLYAVPHDSLLPPERVHAHFEHVVSSVESLIEEAEARGVSPRDIQRAVVPGRRVVPLTVAERDRWFAPNRIDAAFTTCEVAVDPHPIAGALRAAVRRTPAIRFFPHANVERVDGDADNLTVITSSQDLHGPYAHIVNALWDGRLPVDLARGHAPPQSWLWRSKLVIRMPTPLTPFGVPSVTYVLGPYGDMVDYQNGYSYLSWYPAGLLGLSPDPAPPVAWAQVDVEKRTSVLAASLTALAELSPSVKTLPVHAVRAAAVVGGAIFAYGETDIDDPDSGLHQRSAVAVRSCGGYHSIDPGKYCLAPLFAIQVADRIAPDIA